MTRQHDCGRVYLYVGGAGKTSEHDFDRAYPRSLERMGVETSQLALARCVMRGVLGRERSKGRTVEKWRVKTKFCSTYKVHCYG